MANYKVVDADQLDADLKTVADAIREKGGTTESLEFPLGMKSAVENIKSGGSASEEFIGVKYSEFDSVRGNPRVADARSLPTNREDNICGGFPYLFASSSKNANGGWNCMVEDFYLPDGIKSLYGNMFFYCGSIKNIYGDLSNVSIIYGACFQNSNIEKFDYYCPNLTQIQANAFNGCQKLIALTLRGNTVVSLANTSAFLNSPIRTGTGYVYIPSAMIESYQAATNWSAIYASYPNVFRALEEYTVDGTITGALDESKI